MQIIKKILLVDDSKIQQKMLKSLLEKEGYALFIADKVSEGLKIIGSVKIDLVLIDFYLAGINDGTALVSKVRKYGFSTPVYAISGSEENSRELLASGCNGVLSKDPLEIKNFILSLRD